VTLLHPDPHVPGRHCASSTLRDVAHFAGHDLSEAMCFGLGAGLGFTAFARDTLSPSHQMHGRAHDLEGQFFRRLGIEFRWRTEPDAAAGWEAVRREIDRGHPVLLQADLHHLPYYGSRTHFAGHVIGLWGYDAETGVAYVGDTQFPGLQAVPLAVLAAARTAVAPPFALASNWFPGALPGRLPPLADLVVDAIREQAAAMLGGITEGPLVTGVAGMAATAATLPEWDDALDAIWCARFAYQLIERRGTGGGNFRFLYRDFLDEASRELPWLAPLVAAMDAIGAGWSELAHCLKEVSEVPAPDFRPAAALLDDLARRERTLWTGAAGLAR